MLNFAGQFTFDANLDDDRQEKPRLLRSVNRGVLDRRNTRANKPLRGKTRQFSPSGTASKAAKFFGNLSLLPSRHSRSDRLSIAHRCWHGTRSNGAILTLVLGTITLGA